MARGDCRRREDDEPWGRSDALSDGALVVDGSMDALLRGGGKLGVQRWTSLCRRPKLAGEPADADGCGCRCCSNERAGGPAKQSAPP